MYQDRQANIVMLPRDRVGDTVRLTATCYTSMHIAARTDKPKYENVAYTLQFQNDIVAAIGSMMPVLEGAFGMSIPKPKVVFDGKRLVNRLDFAAARYWGHNNTIEIRSGVYEAYNKNGRKLEGWVLETMAHELSHAFIHHYPGRKISAISPLAEGLSDIVGIYGAGVRGNRKASNSEIALEAAKYAATEAHYSMRELKSLIAEIDSHSPKISAKHMISVLEGHMKRTENYARSKLYLAGVLLRNGSMPFSSFIASVLKDGSNPLARPIDEHRIEDLYIMSSKTILRGGDKERAARELTAAIRAEAERLIQQASSVYDGCVAMVKSIKPYAKVTNSMYEEMVRVGWPQWV